MKKSFLLIIFCTSIMCAWADGMKTILPWGADEPWQMKYIQQPSESYTDPDLDASGLEWTQPDYDDSQWETLTGPMANGETLVVDVFNYTWNGENYDFNLRRSFTLNEVDPEGYTIAFLHDDDVRVFVNGALAVEMSGSSDRIQTAKLDASLFHEGDNQLSIFYHGGPYTYNYLDYALFAGNDFDAGNHYNSDLEIPREVSIDHIVYTLNDEQTEAICQGWDWSGGYQPTEGPAIRTTITIKGKDYPVTSIGYYAFMNIDHHWDITVPEGIKYLQGYAFWDSNDIGHISLPSTLLGMGFSSAIPCNIESISVAEGNPVYDSRDNCNAVIETATNTAVVVCDINTLPTSVTALGGYCMTGNRGEGGEGLSIDEFTIPDHITSVGCAFIPNGDYINTLNIPSSVTEIIAPMTLPVPRTVNIASDNPRFYTVGNCILEKGTDILVDTWENSQIPDYITSFGYNSLYHYSGDVTLRERNPKEWSYAGEILGQLNTLKVPRGCIPHYLYQGWADSPFRIITDGSHTYYNHSEGDTWYAPHIDCLNLPAESAGEDVTLSVVLSADQPVTAFQFDLYMPNGMTITAEDIQLSTARTNAANHSLTVQKRADGGWFVKCDSPSDQTFSGNEGEVCTIRVKTSESLINQGAPIVLKNVCTTYFNRSGNKELSEREQLTSYINFFTPIMPPSSDANKLDVTIPSALRVGSSASMSVNLTNENEVIMTEFYLQLPEGISIATDEEGYPDVTINNVRDNNHSLEVVLGEDGLYHFLCYSSANNALNENTGELFHINLIVDENVAPNTYQGSIKGILMSDVDRNELTQPNFTFDFVLINVEMGDANGDGRINGLDIVDLVDYIMDRPADDFIVAASDLNGDGKVNGMDLVKMVALVMSQTAQNAPAIKRAPSMGPSPASLAAELRATSSTEVQLGVQSADEFILTQCIVELQEGVELLDVGSDQQHVATWKSLGDNRYAVVVYSNHNSPFLSNDAMVRFILSDECNMKVSNMMVIDGGRHGHWLSEAYTARVTEIADIMNSETSNIQYFDLQGRKFVNGHLPKGIYVVNGKKTIIK